MVKVDTKTMWIYLTRGDSAIIVFSAENEGGNLSIHQMEINLYLR